MGSAKLTTSPAITATAPTAVATTFQSDVTQVLADITSVMNDPASILYYGDRDISLASLQAFRQAVTSFSLLLSAALLKTVK